METIISELKQEIREQKNTARGAYHKVHKGKGGQCCLPNDHLTRAQWKKLNGEVVRYKMDEPCEWGGFLLMPKDLRLEYVENLRTLYRATDGMLARMWGVSKATISYTFRKLDIPTRSSGDRPTEAERARRDAMWEAFCNGVVGGGDAEKRAGKSITEAPDEQINSLDAQIEPVRETAEIEGTGPAGFAALDAAPEEKPQTPCPGESVPQPLQLARKDIHLELVGDFDLDALIGCLRENLGGG